MKKTTIFGSMLLILGAAGLAVGPSASELEQPILITSAGQSAEVQLVSVLAKRAGLEASLVKLAQPSDLTGKKTLAISIGASLKGLGAAGLDMEQEKNRVQELLQAADQQGVPILVLHLGGEVRRGQLTDEFVSSLIPKARLVIVVKSGNQDGLFSRLCLEHEVTLIEVERAAEALEPLRAAFQ